MLDRISQVGRNESAKVVHSGVNLAVASSIALEHSLTWRQIAHHELSQHRANASHYRYGRGRTWWSSVLESTCISVSG